MRYFYLLALLLTACAKPNIELDTSEMDKSLGAQPIGLVEITKAKSGGTLGVSFAETLGESLYCTGTVLGTGEIVTSTDCLQNKDGSFTPEQMFFHVHVPGESQTRKLGIASIRADAKRNLAYLRTRETLEFPVSRALSIRAKWIEDANSPAPELISATAVTVTEPNRHGKARVLVTSVRLKTFVSPVQVAPPGEDTDTDTNTNTSTSTVTTITPDMQPKVLETHKTESAWVRPRAVNISGLKETSFGSPIFYQNDVVGIVKSGDANIGNGQWIVGD